MKTDITIHSDQELSLWVYNDEWLYKQRLKSRALMFDLCSEVFIFTDDQFETLWNDILEEEENENV